MIDHDNCIFEDKYSTNISLDIFKKVLVLGLSHNDSHADIQCIIYTGNQKFFNWLMGPVSHREHCHSYPHHLYLNLHLYFLGLLHALSLCDVSGCVWHQTSCHTLHILHLSGRSCAFQSGCQKDLILASIAFMSLWFSFGHFHQHSFIKLWFLGSENEILILHKEVLSILRDFKKRSWEFKGFERFRKSSWEFKMSSGDFLRIEIYSCESLHIICTGGSKVGGAAVDNGVVGPAEASKGQLTFE